MKKVYLIPNVITAFGLVCGLFAIFRVSTSFSTDLFSLLQASAILVLLAAVADLADGAVARMIKAQSEFGGHFDSLADAVTFGVAPPLLVLKSLTAAEEPMSRFATFCVVIAAMIYTLCGVLRLVRYNVQSMKPKEEVGIKRTRHFTGLPIPAAASASIAASLILISPLFKEFFPISIMMRAAILAVMLVVLGYFMVSRWKFPGLRALHFRVPSFNLVFVTGILAVLILYGILEYFAIAFFAISWSYLLIAWTLSLIRVIAGKRSKTLAEYEPDDEEDE